MRARIGDLLIQLGRTIKGARHAEGGVVVNITGPTDSATARQVAHILSKYGADGRPQPVLPDPFRP